MNKTGKVHNRHRTAVLLAAMSFAKPLFAQNQLDASPPPADSSLSVDLHDNNKIEVPGIASLAELKNDLMKSFEFGYVGIRHGRSIVKGPLTGKMNFYGLFMEIRGAPLRGLSLYYDVWPTVRNVPDAGQNAGRKVASSFTASRTSIGWSMPVASPDPIDSISVAGRMGVYSTKTEVDIFTSSGIRTKETFSSNSAFNLGAELGAETSTDIWNTNLLTRTWVSRDMGFALGGKTPESSTVTDTRYGLDLLLGKTHDKNETRKVSTSYLLFVLGEDVKFTRTDKNAQIKGMQYQIQYLGGGLAVTY